MYVRMCVLMYAYTCALPCDELPALLSLTEQAAGQSPAGHRERATGEGGGGVRLQTEQGAYLAPTRNVADEDLVVDLRVE